MIARCFGGKPRLHLAVVESLPDKLHAELTNPERLDALIREDTRTGPSPIRYAVGQPFDDAALNDAVRSERQRRLVTPLKKALERDGVSDGAISAEVMTAAFRRRHPRPPLRSVPGDLRRRRRRLDRHSRGHEPGPAVAYAPTPQ